MKEIWMPCWHGFYEVSNTGRVRSVQLWSAKYNKVIKRKQPRELKQETTHDGYKRVVISLFGNHFHYSVHRMVAEAFLPNKNNYPEINHKDEDTQNNNVENLEWCSRKYNANYGTLPKRISERQLNDPKLSISVIQYDMSGRFINSYPSAKEAKRQTGIDDSQILRVCRGKGKSAGGFKWAIL